MVRARDLGIPFEGIPGPLNAITDVGGVEVGHITLISEEGEIEPGKGPARTGVTAILPRGHNFQPVLAATYDLNGAGELTGAHWIDESGLLESGILLTNTASIGAVHSGAMAWAIRNVPHMRASPGSMFWFLPVVSETADMLMNDMGGMFVKPEHVEQAINIAASGPVAEGNVGGGTGMVSYQFKGGIGTASRRLEKSLGGYTLGVLVQANHGRRESLVVAGLPVGKEITDRMPVVNSARPSPQPGEGSLLVVLATDAPLLPIQLKRLARRIPMGVARTGGMGDNSSGDLFLSFSTSPLDKAERPGVWRTEFLENSALNPLFEATVQATEEAIINCLVAAETMTGIHGNTVYALPHELLQEILKRHNRLVNPGTGK